MVVCAFSVDAFYEVHGDCLAGVLVDVCAEIGLDRQFVGAVAESHERASERMSVHGCYDLDEAAGAEVLGAPIGHEIGPAALGWALVQHGGEDLVECWHCGCSPYLWLRDLWLRDLRLRDLYMSEPGVVSSSPVSIQVLSPDRIIGQPP